MPRHGHPSPTPPPIPPTPLPLYAAPIDHLPTPIAGRRSAPKAQTGLVALAGAGNGLAVAKGARPTHSLNRQVILEEDAYTSAMSSIIARDFFPSLERLEATNKYLDAVDSMDERQLEASVRRLIEVDSGRTPARYMDTPRQETPVFDRAETPRYGNPVDTPNPHATPSAYSTFSSSTTAGSKRRRAPAPSASLSLDAFQSAFTSEDNASFTEILREENKQRKVKHSWAWEAEKKAKVLKIEEAKGMRRLIEMAHRVEAEDRGLRIEGTKAGDGEGERKLIEGKDGTSADADEEGRLSKQQKGKGKATDMEVEAPPSTINTDDATVSLSGDPDADEVERMLSGLGSSAPIPASTVVAIASSSPSSSVARISQPTSSTVLIPSDATSALSPPLPSADLPLDPDSHLAIALVNAGLPPTAIDHEIAALRRDQVGDVLATKQDERKVAVPAWDYRTRNALMFGPDADVSPFDPVLSTLPPSSILSTAPKTILHANTRLATSHADEGSSSHGLEVPPSPTRSHIAAAISGTPYPVPSSSQPSIAGYPLVPSLPSPTPSSLGPERLQQLMTWGTLLSTPRALPSESGPTPFRINDPSPRDDIARKLAVKAGRAISERAKGITAASGGGGGGLAGERGKKRKTAEGEMGPPSWTPASSSRRTVELSPAGRGLLERTRNAGGGTPKASGSGSGGLGGTIRTAAGRRGEVMDRGWSLGGSKSAAGTGVGGVGKDVRREMRWSASPSPVVKRGMD